MLLAAWSRPTLLRRINHRNLGDEDDQGKAKDLQRVSRITSHRMTMEVVQKMRLSLILIPIIRDVNV